MVAIMIIAVVATITIPLFTARSPQRVQQEFVDALNGLTRFAWTSAVTQRKVHRIFFDFDKDFVRVEQQKRDEFVPVSGAYLTTSYRWPSQAFQFRNFYIGPQDNMQAGQGAATVWFFINEQGISQPVVINIYNQVSSDSTEDAQPFSLVLNPFLAQFKLYEEFQEPPVA